MPSNGQKASHYKLSVVLELTLLVLGSTPPELELTQSLLRSTLNLHRIENNFLFYQLGSTILLLESTPSLAQHSYASVFSCQGRLLYCWGRLQVSLNKFMFLTFPVRIDSSPIEVDSDTTHLDFHMRKSISSL